MTRWTERQLAAFLAWLDLQWDVPDRHDWYSMQVAYMQSTGKHKIEDFRLRFDRARKPVKRSKRKLLPGPAPKMPRRLTAEDIIKIQSQGLKFVAEHQRKR